MKKIHVLIMLLYVPLLTGQELGPLDFDEGHIDIAIDTVTRQIKGNVTYRFTANRKVDSVYLDAVSMNFKNVRINGRKVRFRRYDKGISLYKRLKAGSVNKLLLEYEAQPSQTVYFIGWNDSIASNNQIWTQGQGKYSSHWVPSFDAMTEKVIYNLSITFDKDYEVVANGKLISSTEQSGVKTWNFEMKHPMSSYLLAFAAGRFETDSLRSSSGIPIQLYYEREDSLRAEPTYRYSRQIFDFLETEIGIPYPWRIYRQVPVRDFLYAGMENTTCTFFSNSYMIDSVSFKDRNYVNINAHELAHQWFGNLVTEESGKHHWLHEGFATYYAYLAEKDIFGDDYFYWRLFDTARILDRLESEEGGEALNNPGAGSITFYEKGAWALYMLAEEVGKDTFTEGIRKYLSRFRYHTATIEEFIEVMESVYGKSLDAFAEKWLYETHFPYQEAISRIAADCRSIGSFISLQNELSSNAGPNEPIIKRYWQEGASSRWKETVIKTYFNSLSETFIRNALEGGDLKVRQSIALETIQIPADLKEVYETLLSDESYVTIEAVLYKLWIYFDADREKYLEKSRGIYGFPNGNVRMLWLTLAALTPGFDEELKQEYLAELRNYTRPLYGFETRQLAFQYLKEAFTYSDSNLKDLINASVHHSWRFRSFARHLLDETLKKEHYLNRIKALSKELPEEELNYIRTKISEE